MSSSASMSAVRTSQAATADDMTAVQRLRQSLHGIRNDSLSFADEHGFSVDLELDRSASDTLAAPTEAVDLAVERAEAQIVTERSSDVFQLSDRAQGAARSLLTT